MSEAMTPPGSSVVAVYPDHDSAEGAIRLLHKNGFEIEDLSIIGRNIQMTEEPTGFVSTGDYVVAGAKSGAMPQRASRRHRQSGRQCWSCQGSVRSWLPARSRRPFSPASKAQSPASAWVRLRWGQR